MQIEPKDGEPECSEAPAIHENNETITDLREKQNEFFRTPLTSPGTSDSNDNSETVSNQDNQKPLTCNTVLHAMNKDHTYNKCYSEVEKSKIEFYQAQKELRGRTQSNEDMKIPISPRQLLVNFLTVLLSQWVTHSTLEYLNLVNIEDQRLQSREEQGTRHHILCSINGRLLVDFLLNKVDHLVNLTGNIPVSCP